MNPQTLDNVAIGLALGGIVLRLTGKPWWASILCSISLLCSAVAQSIAHRRIRPWS